MSAVAVVTVADGVAVVADGVAYDYRDGHVGYFASKIAVSPDRNLAVAWTGLAGFGTAFLVLAEQNYATFDDIVDHVADLAFRSYTQLVGGFGLWQEPEEHRKATLVVAGLSNRRGRWEAYQLSSYAQGTNLDGVRREVPAWELIVIGDNIWCSTFAPKDVLACFGVLDEVDPLHCCVRLVCAARSQSGRLASGLPYGVGGFVQTVRLQAGRYDSEIVHRWPDPLGEPIVPSRGEALPPWLK